MKTRLHLVLVYALISIVIWLPFSSNAQTPELENADAVIEYDSIEIISSGKKSSLIRLLFKRKVRVKIQSREAISSFRKIVLPESYDPALICHSSESQNLGKYLTNVNIEKFSVRFLRPDGKIDSLRLIPVHTSIRSLDLTKDRFGYYDEFTYHIDGIRVGDVLEFEYKYSVLYSENLFSLMTFRIFFHGEYPILKKDVVFKRAKALEADITTYFADDPVEIAEKASTSFQWSFDKLPGCMKESCIRPYTSLPYVIISLKPYEMIYTLPYSFQEKFIPFYVFGPSFKESHHLAIARAMVEGVNTPQYNQLRRFLKERITDLPADTTGYNQLYSVQNFIAEEFTYDPDIKYYERDDIRKERFGDDITARRIRDRSRYNVYVGLIFGLGLNYFTGYLSDIRSGVISDNYFEPTISNDYIFAAMLKSNALQFIYPKKDRFGYFLNELPFYFENTTVRLIYLDDFRNYKEAIQERFLSTQTPSSNSNDNTRSLASEVSVDVDGLKVHFDARISLSGQFSTLGRGAYLYDNHDPTVNPAYYTKFWENISEEIEPDQLEVENIETDFPFRAVMNTSFDYDSCLRIKNDTLHLDIKGWFSHIVDDYLHAENRILTYYPDFKYTDTYNYLITFSKPVKVVDRLPVVQLNNSYGNINIKCVQKMDGSLLLSSRVVITAEKIQPNNIMDVAEIQDQLMALNQLKIKLVKR